MILRVVRRVLGSVALDWRKGELDLLYSEQEWRLRRGLQAEVAKMKVYQVGIGELRRETARALTEAPWAREVTIGALREGLGSLRSLASNDVGPGKIRAVGGR